MINTAHEEGEFISPIFLRSKPDGTNRVILNLKNLNQTLKYNQFKMETIRSVAHLIQQNYSGPRKFTQLIKPPLAVLRLEGIITL